VEDRLFVDETVDHVEICSRSQPDLDVGWDHLRNGC